MFVETPVTKRKIGRKEDKKTHTKKRKNGDKRENVNRT